MIRKKLMQLIDEIIELYPSELEKLADALIANGVTVQKWISVKDRLPKPETEVLVLVDRYGIKIITTAIYEDGHIYIGDSEWFWYEYEGDVDDFDYDEEKDDYLILESWWELKHYNSGLGDVYNHPIDDVVTHWMPLPEPQKESENN